jgi:hypothetical protein
VSLSFGETKRDFGVRGALGSEFGLVSVLGQMITSENDADRKLLRESGIRRRFLRGSMRAQKITPGSKMFRHRGLSGSDAFGTDDRRVMKPKDFFVSHDLKVGTIVGTNRST